MNNKQKRRIEMFNTVGQYLGQHRPIWEGIKVFNEAFTELQGNIRSIADKIRKQSAPTFGATNERDQVRLEFEHSILEMASQLGVLASRTQDLRLTAESELTISTLDGFSVDTLLGTGERIVELLKANLAALADFGITTTDIAAMEALMEEYRTAKSAPRMAIAERSRETITMPALIRSTTSLLRNQVDKLMLRFRSSHPEFFAGYVTARVVLLQRSSGGEKAENTEGTPANIIIPPGVDAASQANQPILN